MLTKKQKYLFLIIFFLISLISSMVLIGDTSEICDPGKGCDLVQNSPYASTFGIKNSVYGLFIFSFLIIILFLQLKRESKMRNITLKIGVFSGFLVALYFIYLQAYVINAWCKYCMIVDTIMIASMIILLIPTKNG